MAAWALARTATIWPYRLTGVMAILSVSTLGVIIAEHQALKPYEMIQQTYQQTRDTCN